MTVETTRSRILDHLRKYQTATVAELSSFLGKTGADIRHHLAILEANDLVENIGKRKDRRGRPMNYYGLPQRMLGDETGNLAGLILDTWISGLTDRAQVEALRSIARRVAGVIPIPSDGSLPGQLGRAVGRLNELSYHARWEASASGPRIILGNCPYAPIIAGHPELCQMDAFVLEDMLGTPVTQTGKLQTSIKGLPFCTFLVRRK